jgi:hypothetical protein
VPLMTSICLLLPAMLQLLLLLLAQRPADVAAYPGPYPPGGSCNTLGQPVLCIGAPTASNAVLQRGPGRAAITGSVPPGWGTPPMTVTIVLTDEEGKGNDANVSTEIRPDLTWKALLPPRPAFGNYSLTAACTAGCAGANATGTAPLVNLTYGDVYVCAGQVWHPSSRELRTNTRTRTHVMPQRRAQHFTLTLHVCRLRAACAAHD